MAFLALINRAGVNPGIIAGTTVTTAENSKHSKPVSRAGVIAIIVFSSIILILLGVIAVCIDKRNKRKARQGEILRDGDEEASRPLAEGRGGGSVSMAHFEVPRPLNLQSEMQPPQPTGIGLRYGEQRYDMGGYASPPMEGGVGQQGTQYYRNQ